MIRVSLIDVISDSTLREWSNEIELKMRMSNNEVIFRNSFVVGHDEVQRAAEEVAEGEIKKVLSGVVNGKTKTFNSKTFKPQVIDKLFDPEWWAKCYP